MSVTYMHVVGIWHFRRRSMGGPQAAPRRELRPARELIEQVSLFVDREGI
jgi:hypothetical protein